MPEQRTHRLRVLDSPQADQQGEDEPPVTTMYVKGVALSVSGDALALGWLSPGGDLGLVALGPGCSKSFDELKSARLQLYRGNANLGDEAFTITVDPGRVLWREAE